MSEITDSPDPAVRYRDRLARALDRIEAVRPFAKLTVQPQVLDAARRLLLHPDGLPHLTELAPRFDAAGVFAGTDWEDPANLVPQLVKRTLTASQPATVVLECLSELRLLAIARGESRRDDFSAEDARRFLTQVLALNLNRVYASSGEIERVRLGAPLADAVHRLFRHLLDEIGFEDILGSMIDEAWRVLEQRPLRVTHVKAMIAQVAVELAGGEREVGGAALLGADRLVSALFQPTRACEDDPGVDAYVNRVAEMDKPALQREARGFARAMHDTGLVSDYHAVFLRWLNENDRRELIGDALGLTSTGADVLRAFPLLVQRLIAEAIHPETAQCVYGLAMLLERGLLHTPTMAPALWRQIHLVLTPAAAAALAGAHGERVPPRVYLLAGVIALLGQPLGVGQGMNPTCQAARAISMWSLSDPDFLLHLVTQAARTDTILMQFEGLQISSAELPPGLSSGMVLDTDPVSTLLVPHLDRVYAHMGRLCAGRGDDPHRWINPEFHGWWVGRDFRIAVDVPTGLLRDYERFVRDFYACYHPDFNGGNPIIHPQPAGLAVTDSLGAFVGWHAITLLRVARRQDGETRLYFYNPNDDSGQQWGDGVTVSTHGCGERHGEASLPFAQLASRLYIFHFDSTVADPRLEPPAGEVEAVIAMAHRTWAASRVPVPGP